MQNDLQSRMAELKAKDAAYQQNYAVAQANLKHAQDGINKASRALVALGVENAVEAEAEIARLKDLAQTKMDEAARELGL